MMSVMAQFDYNKKSYKENKNKIDFLFENISKNKFLGLIYISQFHNYNHSMIYVLLQKIKRILKFLNLLHQDN